MGELTPNLPNLSHQQARALISHGADTALNSIVSVLLESHLAGCAECAEYARRLQSLDRALSHSAARRFPAPSTSQAGINRTLAAIRPRLRRATMQQRASTLVYRVALAAVIILAFAGLIFTLNKLAPPAPQPAQQTPTTQPSGTAPVVVVAPTATPAPTGIPLPTIDPALAPAQLPEGWVAYTDSDLHAGLAYPAAWKPQPDGSFRGEDGFFQLVRYERPASALTLESACLWEANASTYHLQYYGGIPAVTLGTSAGQDSCLVATALNQNITSRSALLVANPWLQDGVLALFADPAHLQPIADSLFIAPPPQATPAGAETVPNEGVPPEPRLVTRQVSGYTLDEYAVVDARVDAPGHFEFNDRIPEELRNKRADLRSEDPMKAVAPANEQLKPLGYEIVVAADGTTMTLMKGDVKVLDPLTEFHNLSVSADGSKFVMLVYDGNWQPKLLTQDGLAPWDPAKAFNNVTPVYVGEDLVSVQPGGMTDNGFPTSAQVLRNGEPVFSFALAAPDIRETVAGLWSVDGHWVLEVSNFIIRDGENLNAKFGYDQAFGFDVVAGQPFYYFLKDGQYGIAVGDDSDPLDVKYDNIFHGECCEASAFNPGSSASMAWFYALRDGIWHYVEIGQYE